MNILIVDDNANNRMVLRLLLEEYQDNNNTVNFDIEEASNGLEAVQMCEYGEFDIVLMDIEMPSMDGIDATKIIRGSNPNVLIIAVSSVEDCSRQKKILCSGAEDYVSKPINHDIFASRMTNYITIAESRHHKKNNKYKINLFNNEVYSRHTKFIVNSEDSLSEFWEFFLLNAEEKYDNLSDVVRTIFSISDTQLRLSVVGDIYIEESDETQYFTLTGIDKLPKKVIELILKKNPLECRYKIEDGKISFELYKVYSVKVEEQKTAVKDKIEPVAQEKKTVAVEENNNISKKLQVFDYIDKDDLSELEEFAGKLNSLMLVVGSGDVTEEEAEEIYTYLENIGSVLATYTEIYPISKALTALAQDMSTHKEEFTKNSEALGPMCKAFSSDLLTWIQMSFHTGAPSVDFMNDTIVVNCETIAGMLKMGEPSASGEEDLDDIFDF